MTDTQPQTASGKVLWHFTMSLDGFVAGPGHAIGWMTGFTLRPGLVDEYVKTTGAVLGGRDGWDAAVVGGSTSLRRRLEGTDLRPHPPPRRRDPGRRGHIPELRPGRGGAHRARGGRRKEPRGVLANDRPSAAPTGLDRRDRPAHRPDPARRRNPAIRQPQRSSDSPRASWRRRGHVGRERPSRSDNRAW